MEDMTVVGQQLVDDVSIALACAFAKVPVPTDVTARIDRELPQFQADAGIPVTGKVDAATEAKLEEMKLRPSQETMAQIKALAQGRETMTTTGTPPTTGVKAKIRQIQETKETEKQKADGKVMTDEHAVHAVHTPWQAPTTLSSAAVGALIGFPFGGPIGSAIGAAIGASVEHFRIAGGPVGKLTTKLGLFKTKAPDATVAK